MIVVIPLILIPLSKAESATASEIPSLQKHELPYIPYDYIVSSDYSITNNDWNGASKIYELTKKMGYPTAMVESFKSTVNSREKNSILVILYPDFGIDPVELHDYVAKGGNVLIADDFGYGNYVLSEFQISFGPAEVYDDENNYGGKNYAPIISFNEPFFAEPITNVVTNHPTYFVSREKVLAYFPETSYADKNFNGMNNPGETDGPLVFARALNVGAGRMIILSDPSVFINGMLETGDNKALYESIISWLSGGSKAYTVFFEKRLDNIPKLKISSAGKRLNESENNFNEAEKQCNAGDYEKCMDLTAEGQRGIDSVQDTLFGRGGKERTKSEIENSLKEIESLKKEINTKKSGKDTVENEQYLNNAKDKLEAAISEYSMGDYSNALRFSKEGEDSISKAREILYDKNRILGAKIELERAKNSLTRLKEEIGNTENNDNGIKKGNKLLILILSFLEPLFVLQTWLLLFLGLIALFLGEKYAPIISAFFKKSNTVSRYQYSMQKVMSSDRYNEPAKILVQEFKGIFYKKIGAEYDTLKKEVMEKAFAKYPFMNKRRLDKTLTTIEKIEREGGTPRFSGKNFEKLYSDVHAILNEIKEAETIENSKIR